MESMSVSSCRCCMFVSCVHPVAIPNAAFCITCSLLMLVEDAKGDHTASQHIWNQKQTRGAQPAYSRHTCRHHHNSGMVYVFYGCTRACVCRCDVVVVVCPLQPYSYVSSGCPGPESSILVSSRWACPISSQVTDH